MKKGWRWVALIGAALLLSACGRHGCLTGGGWERGWGPMMFPGGGMFVGAILLIVLVVAVVWWLTKGRGAKDRVALPKESPIDILKRRYAAGEITKEQLDSMKKDLES